VRPFLRLAVAFGLPFGLLMAGFGVLAGDIESAGEFFLIAAIMGLPFGLVMAAVLGTLHRRAGGGPPRLGPSAQATVEVPLPSHEAVELCAGAAGAVRKARTPEIDETRSEVSFRVGPTWMSWGERVTMRVQQGVGESTVVVRSRARVRATLVDYGRNQANVDHLVRRLHDESGAAGQASGRQDPDASIA